jgi:hypothetical protein
LEILFYDVAYDVVSMIDYPQRAHGEWCHEQPPCKTILCSLPCLSPFIIVNHEWNCNLNFHFWSCCNMMRHLRLRMVVQSTPKQFLHIYCATYCMSMLTSPKLFCPKVSYNLDQLAFTFPRFLHSVPST